MKRKDQKPSDHSVLKTMNTALHRWTSWLLILIGLLLMTIPLFLQSASQKEIDAECDSVTAKVEQLSSDQMSQMLQDARDWNSSLSVNSADYKLDDEQESQYRSLLNPDQDDVMGLIQIPRLHLTLPVYHGTDESILQKGAGHIEGSSLPVGGKGSHAVISSHSGLEEARLFTDLDKLQEGDEIKLMILDQKLTYKVTDSEVVDPDITGLLQIDPDQDQLTLITCTPVGINSHRLLVHAVRADDQAAAKTAAEMIYSCLIRLRS